MIATSEIVYKRAISKIKNASVVVNRAAIGRTIGSIEDKAISEGQIIEGHGHAAVDAENGGGMIAIQTYSVRERRGVNRAIVGKLYLAVSERDGLAG